MIEVQLTKGFVAIVDDADADIAASRKWYAHCAPGKELVYARSGCKKNRAFLHRLICKTPPGYVTDHINGNTLDNRRANLRIATVSQNAANQTKREGTSPFKGVSWSTRDKAWLAQITPTDSNKIRLGRFSTQEEAARAYDTAAKQFFGPFARLNFPDTQSFSPPVIQSSPQEPSKCLLSPPKSY